MGWRQTGGRGWRWKWKPGGRQAPVLIILGAGRHRAGPDLAGSLWGGGETGRSATPTGQGLPAPQVPASTAGQWGARVQGELCPPAL